MFTASRLLTTQPRMRGKCLSYRYGPSPTVTSKHHYGLAVRSRCARPVASVAMQSQIHAWHNAGLPNQVPKLPHEAEPVGRWRCRGRARSSSPSAQFFAERAFVKTRFHSSKYDMVRAKHDMGDSDVRPLRTIRRRAPKAGSNPTINRVGGSTVQNVPSPNPIVSVGAIKKRIKCGRWF